MLQDLPIIRGAQFDDTGQYRYRLTRQWDRTRPSLTIIMLNPSQADTAVDDPTIRRCMGLAHPWGFGSIIVVNLFAYRTAYPRRLGQVEDPVGPHNNTSLWEATQTSPKILLAWGNGGHLHQRDIGVLELLSPFRKKWCYLHLNRSGQPRHPLYIRRNASLQPWP